MALNSPPPVAIPNIAAPEAAAIRAPAIQVPIPVNEALRTHLTDPDIDIDYDSVKNKLGWLIKIIIAGRLASTCV